MKCHLGPLPLVCYIWQTPQLRSLWQPEVLRQDLCQFQTHFLVLWPPLCCQVLFSHITPRHRTQPVDQLPQEVQPHQTFDFVGLTEELEVGGRVLGEDRILPHLALPLLSSPSSFLSFSKATNKLYLPRLPGLCVTTVIW